MRSGTLWVLLLLLPLLLLTPADVVAQPGEGVAAYSGRLGVSASAGVGVGGVEGGAGSGAAFDLALAHRWPLGCLGMAVLHKSGRGGEDGQWAVRPFLGLALRRAVLELELSAGPSVVWGQAPWLGAAARPIPGFGATLQLSRVLFGGVDVSLRAQATATVERGRMAQGSSFASVGIGLRLRGFD